MTSLCHHFLAEICSCPTLGTSNRPREAAGHVRTNRAPLTGRHLHRNVSCMLYCSPKRLQVHVAPLSPPNSVGYPYYLQDWSQTTLCALPLSSAHLCVFFLASSSGWLPPSPRLAREHLQMCMVAKVMTGESWL